MAPYQNIHEANIKNILTFIDDFSRKIYVFFLISKNEIYSSFLEYMVENETDRTIKTLRTDNEQENIRICFLSEV